jgi:protein-S-isoprenylcysteine O-methyltransferase Ste14
MSETRKAWTLPGIAFRLGGEERQIPWAIALPALVGGVLGYVVSLHRLEHPRVRPTLVPFSPMAVCFYLWLVLSLYWSLQARRASAAKSAESGPSRALHVTLISAAQLLAFWFYPGWPFLESPPFAFPRVLPESPYLTWLGLLVQAGSLLFALWARRHLGRNWSGEVTLKVDHKLVRSGPYRRIRHPIYTGAIGMYVGPALVSDRLQGILALALVGVAYARKIRQEEHALRGEFGPAYEDYHRGTWALIPGLF